MSSKVAEMAQGELSVTGEHSPYNNMLKISVFSRNQEIFPQKSIFVVKSDIKY